MHNMFLFFDFSVGAGWQFLAEDTLMANTEDGKPDVSVNHDKMDVGMQGYL